MSADQGDTSPPPSLLAALAAPAVIVDGRGLVASWNAAAEVRLGMPADGSGRALVDAIGPLAAAGRRVALADGAGSLIVWALDEDGLGPDDIALQKADALGRVAGGILHDVKGKFMAITGIADLVHSEPGMTAELRVFSGQLRTAGEEALALAQTALEYARSDPYKPQLVAVGPVIRSVVDLMAHATMNMDPRVNVPNALPQVETDLALFRQAMLALVVSAIEAQGADWARGANPVPGRLRISGSVRDDVLGCRVRIAIEDGGAVVPDAERKTLFSGSGGARAGRDLAVARAIITRAGGRIAYEPVWDGNRIVVELPVAGTVLPPLPEPDPIDKAEPADRRPLVLICDDEPLIRGLLVRFLERSGLDAVEARDGREAIEVLSSRPVAMIVADQQMPDLSGSDLFDIVVARDPTLASRFILTSGDPGRADVVAFTARTGVPVLPKPWDNGRLAALIRDAVSE